MENAAKALGIAGGVLIAVLLIVVIVNVFTAMGEPQSEQDKALLVEQIAAFNQEYEVYNKNLMYGVDLISVMNKAYNQNMKNNTNKTSMQYERAYNNGETFQVDIAVLLKNELTASGEVTYERTYNGNKTVVEYFPNTGGSGTSSIGNNAYTTNKDKLQSIKLSTAGISGNDNKVKAFNRVIKNGKLEDKSINEIILTSSNHFSVNHDKKYVQKDGKYVFSIKDNNDFVDDLIEEDLQYQIVNANANERNIWYKITINTATNDLKSRKFRCTGVEYNNNTGRISKMSFEEI